VETFAKQRFYITTAIDYTSGPPHIGHSLQKIAADVLARWHRSLGEDVYFLTGTDEHGLKIQRIAEKAGKKPQEFVDELAREFKSAWDALNIKYDVFYRTTNSKHKRAVQNFTKLVNEKGDIYKGTYEGLYCADCEAYITEKELVNGCCPIHTGKKPELIKEETYFFRLSKYQNLLLDLYEKNPKFILPETRKNEIANRVKEGLKDLSVSRTSFSWGIPFPLDKKHVTYVWFDALFNYISALGWPSGSKFKKYWPANVHILGKDNGWFHTVIWPAMLMSAGIEPPKTVYVHGFLTFNGQKISKSLGNVIDPRFLASKYGADAYRYYVLRENPISEDGDFSEKALINRINTDLANSLGNLLSRTVTLIEKFSDGKIPRGKKTSSDLPIMFEDKFRHVSAHLEKFEFHHALEKIWEFVNHVNKHINDEKPWELATKEDAKSKEHLHNILYNCAESLRLISALISPFMPATAEEIAKQLGIEKVPELKKIKWGKLKTGTQVQKGTILFAKVESAEQMDASDPFAKLDIRCAKILEVHDIEGADKLYKLEVDLGKVGKRIVVAGIKKYYKKEELKGKKIALLANLEPAKIRGVQSEGMILAGQDGEKVEALLLNATEPGEQIYAEEIVPAPVKILTYDEFAKISITVDGGKIMHNGKHLRSEKEHISISLQKGIVK